MNEDLSKLNLIDLLGQLSPVAEPPTISLWPQTEAWGWVGVVAVVLAAWLIRRLLLQRHANAYRRVALREIDAAGDSLGALAEILRRTALVAFPRAEVAGLYGDEWLSFLDRTSSGSDFREGVGRSFASAPYVATAEGSEQPEKAARVAETKQLVALAVRWVRHHRKEAGGGSS